MSSGGGVALLLECMAKSRANAEFEVYGTLKRKGGKLERQLKTKFNRKGIIMAEVKKEAVSLLEVSVFLCDIIQVPLSKKNTDMIKELRFLKKP